MYVYISTYLNQFLHVTGINIVFGQSMEKIGKALFKILTS